MTGAADPCYATSKSLAEAWENTEACLLEKGALSRYLNLVATAALGLLVAVFVLVAAGVYSQKLAREQRATPAACRALLRAVRFAVPLAAAHVSWPCSQPHTRSGTRRGTPASTPSRPTWSRCS